LRIDRKTANEYGFGEATVTLDVAADSPREIIAFLREILDENADYRFFIDTLTIPDQREDEAITLNIPLKIFYK